MPKTGLSAHKVHAALIEFGVKGIVGGDFNGEAIGMGRSPVATFGRLICPRVPRLSCEGNVVVNVLPPGNKDHGHGVIVKTLIFMNLILKGEITALTECSIFDGDNSSQLCKGLGLE